ncbi:hypothetical protein [Alterisphingorhabdus coralli]|uniref:DUF937 domain-containing protein n=1 Tax=Alterisphingorhabdus coralli TaxID=3071408 RepID=A0AA97F4C3_9SPHN|nr:hypothetical protein [Parasphingorhabdus sp. SCSIO 66989]WOE73801.1 hypothetical protein RB602_07940 [Parasphingorhabdus sp. SCSIO 66989]
MSGLDSILNSIPVGANSIGEIAEKLGIDSALVEKGVAALGKSHPETGDTVTLASQQTSLDTSTLSSIVSQLGGEGGLGQISELLNSDEGMMGKITSFLDQDGDGNPLDDIAGMASKLFGKK